jgi:hypothetical protein
MLKLIGWIIKITLFSIAILIIGAFVRWDGKTISDQIRTHLSYATSYSPHVDAAKASRNLKNEIQGHWREIKEKLSNGTEKAPSESDKNQLTKLSSSGVNALGAGDEEIPPSERQKLRALIRELNSSRSKD